MEGLHSRVRQIADLGLSNCSPLGTAWFGYSTCIILVVNSASASRQTVEVTRPSKLRASFDHLHGADSFLKSWKADSYAAGKEALRILCKPSVHCPTHNGLPLFPFLNQINPVHNSPVYLLKIHFNITHNHLHPTLPSELRLFPHQNSVCISLPYVLHSPVISSPLFWLPEKYLVYIPKHEAPHYAVLSSVLSLPLCILRQRGSKLKLTEVGPAWWHWRDFGVGWGVQVPPSPIFSYLGIVLFCCKVALGQTNNGLSGERGVFLLRACSIQSPPHLTRS